MLTVQADVTSNHDRTCDPTSKKADVGKTMFGPKKCFEVHPSLASLGDGLPGRVDSQQYKAKRQKV